MCIAEGRTESVIWRYEAEGNGLARSACATFASETEVGVSKTLYERLISLL